MFLGGVTFLALGAVGLGGVIAPMRAELPPRLAVWTAAAPLPLLAFALDGRLSRVPSPVVPRPRGSRVADGRVALLATSTADAFIPRSRPALVRARAKVPRVVGLARRT